MPHGVDTSYLSPMTKTKNRPEILFVGRMHYWKGINVFLEMIPQVLSKFPECVFKMHAPVDKHSFYFKEISVAVRQARVKFKNNLIFEDNWGGYQFLNEYYRNADVLVFPSHCEGFGIPLIEAMACGIPCVVADTPPMNEIVLDGVTGFCLPLDKSNAGRYHGLSFPNHEAMAEKVISLLSNNGLREKMGKMARERVKSEYELSSCMKKLVCCVKKALRDE